MHGSWRMYRCVKQASWHGATVRFLRAISHNAIHRATSPPILPSPSSSLPTRVQFDLEFLQIFPYARKWPGDTSLTHCGPDRYCKMLNKSRWGAGGVKWCKEGWASDRSSYRTEWIYTDAGVRMNLWTRTRKAGGPTWSFLPYPVTHRLAGLVNRWQLFYAVDRAEKPAAETPNA